MFDKLCKLIAVIILIVLGFFVLTGIQVEAASLFEVTDENSPFYPELDKEETSLPDYAVNEDGDILINEETTLKEVLSPPEESGPGAVNDMLSVSGNDAGKPATKEDVESLMESALADARATNLSVADAYLSSAIVDVFSRVVEGIPYHYKYAAYRLNASDNNEGYMVYGPKAKVNGNYLDFESGSSLIHYYRIQHSSSYQTWYEYKYDISVIHDTYRVPYGTGQLIYTNMVKGYPVLSEITENHLFSVFASASVIVLAFIFIMRRKQ